MGFRNRKGFTLIEVIVVAAIIAILAGILVPMIFNQIDESKKTKAQGDCKTIQTAIMAFRGNVGLWPYFQDPSLPITGNMRPLLSSGSTTDTSQLPTLPASFITTDVDTLENQLMKNQPSGGKTYDTSKFKGPYVQGTFLDPWGKAYVVNADAFDAVDSNNRPLPVWVISAGPDMIVQTDALATEICRDSSNTPITPCDDIGIRIK